MSECQTMIDHGRNEEWEFFLYGGKFHVEMKSDFYEILKISNFIFWGVTKIYKKFSKTWRLIYSLEIFVKYCKFTEFAGFTKLRTTELVECT